MAPIALAAVLAACGGATRTAGGPVGGANPSVQAAAPASAVEQFLGFAKQQRFTEMGYLFGTARGPIAESQEPQRVARRMQAIANAVRHDAFSLSGMVPVPGRPEARRIIVELRQRGRTVQVPFMVVPGPGGTWLVEMVDVEAALRGAPR